MQTVTLPESGLEVSVVGLGCWAIGGRCWGPDVREEDSIAAIREALELGVTLFDTAPLYGDGEADRVLRKALGDDRHRVVIATKVGARREGGHAVSDLSPAHLREDLEGSLRRLGLERIKLLQIHWPCERGTPLEESLGALMELRREGKVEAIGLCNYGPDETRAAKEIAGVQVLQTPLSLLRQEYLHQLAPTLEEEEVAALAYEPLCRGLLSGKHRRLPRFEEGDLRRQDPRFWALRFARAQPLIERVRRISAMLGCAPSALAIAWVLRQRAVAAALVGAKRPEQVRENVQAAALLRRPAIWAPIEEAFGRVRG